MKSLPQIPVWFIAILLFSYTIMMFLAPALAYKEKQRAEKSATEQVLK
jgi:hypothetical protein